mgnify:CR=1 FL=1
MEEKINNKRIFSYVPSIIAKIILESELKDEDVFFNNNNKSKKTRLSSMSPTSKHKQIFDRHSSVQTNPEVFPLEYPLDHSIIMSVKLKGFQELILNLGINDPKRQKEKLNCEYLPILITKMLLQISSIITENGGEILKFTDFEFFAIWDFSNIDIKYIHQYQYFYSKHAVISAYDIMKKVDNTEIIKGYKIKISIGIAYGESSIFFFGGERRRSDYVLMGETIEESENCLNQCGPHEIIIGREMNNFFKGKGEIFTEQVGTDDKNKNIYKLNIANTDEAELKNFQNFKNIKLNSNYIVMNQKVYENLAKKVYILSSVLPQGLVKYLDIGEDANLKELSIITIMTVHIVMDLDLIDNSRQVQYLIRDMQKATYLTRGSLLGVTRTFKGLMIKSVWGLEPNTFVDETARAIATAFVMKKLIKIYQIKINIGIATGCCFTGLVNIQGNRKMYSLLGYKAIISRLLADKASKKNIRTKHSLFHSEPTYSDNFIVYCDRETMKYSQKWYRHNYVNDLYMFNDSSNDENANNSISKAINEFKKKSISPNNDKFLTSKIKRFKTISQKKHKQLINRITKFKNSNSDLNNSNINNESTEKVKLKNSIKIDEIYTPIEYDEYFFQTTLDPFPLIRTYKFNSHNTKNNTYSNTNYLNNIYINNFDNDNDIDNKDIANEDKNTDNNFSNMNLVSNKENAISSSKTIIIKREPLRKSGFKQVSSNIKNNYKKKINFAKIGERFESIHVGSNIIKANKEEKNIYTYINRLNFDNNISKDSKSLIKLKKSQNIFGLHDKIELLLNHMKRILKQNKSQFYIIRGPLGVGKSLFIRKTLNNFIGLNDNLGQKYFKTDYQFLFCNSLNPFTSILPYNIFSCIFRKIYLLLRLEKKINEIISLFDKLNLDDQTISNICFILSLGRDDINLLKDPRFLKLRKKSKKSLGKFDINKKINNKKGKIKEANKNIFTSIIKDFEGPFNYENIHQINIFFFEMIELYSKTLRSKIEVDKFVMPIIFVLDDIQLSDKFSVSFIEFLFNNIILNKNNNLNPFILIMAQQTPFNNNFRGLNPPELDSFLKKNVTLNFKKNIESKIICLDIPTVIDKNILKKIIIFNFKKSVLKQYGTELSVVDNKILDFLLTKSFNGIPFLVITLLKSLINSDKFIQTLSGEFIITSELKDESDVMDWNDIILPYIYEKITSNSMNKLLNFREILILKYASIMGTMFDIKILDKINPLSSIIKIEDIIILTEKLNKEHFVELFNDNQTKKNKLICKFAFPFLRETLYQKFLMETRAPLHMKLAGVISMSKRIIYFSLDDEIKLLKRHLFNSEINIINELKLNKTEIKTTKDILQTKKDLSFNNLKILLIKEICHNFYRSQLDNLLDGNLEMYKQSKSSWIRVYYIINTKKIMVYNQDDEKKEKEERRPILMLALNSIFRNEIDNNKFNKTKNNVLEICVGEEGSIWTRGFLPRKKMHYFFASEKIKDIYQLEIGINFLKMKVNYDDFTEYYGSARFPLYKMKWFEKKEEKYFFDSENNIKYKLWDISENDNNKKRKKSHVSVEKLIDQSQGLKKPFSMLMKSAWACFFGVIQENIFNFNRKSYNISNNDNEKSYLVIKTPNHIQKVINKLFLLDSFINKNNNSNISNNNSNNISLNTGKESDISKSILSINNMDDTLDKNNIISKKNTNTSNSTSVNNSIISHSTITKKDSKTVKFRSINKPNKKISIKSNNSIDYNDIANYSIDIEEYPKTTKNIDNDKHVLFQHSISIPKITFPKNPLSTRVNKIKEEKEIEPQFTESNYDTINNSEKLTASTNIKSPINNNDKNKLSSENNIFDYSFLDLNNNINNKKNKINEKPIPSKKPNQFFNFEGKRKILKSRNKASHSLNSKQANKDNKILKNKRKSIKVLSNDDIFRKIGELPGDFVPFKSKKELTQKHVNVLSNDESFGESQKSIKVYLDIKFNEDKSPKNLPYIKLGDDPRFMYVDYYHNNMKIHKSKIFNLSKSNNHL